MKPTTWTLLGLFLLWQFTRKKNITGHAIVNKGVHGIKKSKWHPPYTPTGRTTFANTKNKSGVYLINENGKTVYVGYSAQNLYRTLYRHFQEWNHRWQQVITYKGKRNTYTIRVIITTPQQAPRLETYLINKLQPRDNEMKYATAEANKGKIEYDKIKTAEPFEPLPF